MAFTKQDVVDKAILMEGLDTQDASLMAKLDVTAEMVIDKTDVLLGYDCTTADKLLNILAEISVKQLSHYQNLRGNTTATKRITRGDYTVEYDTTTSVDIFSSYEGMLKKFKKLVTR